MKPRVLFAGLFHETHTFVDGATAWSDFEVTYGDAILQKLGDASPTDGFLTAAAELGFEVIPTIDARVSPGGIVEDEAFDAFWRGFVERAAPALAARDSEATSRLVRRSAELHLRHITEGGDPFELTTARPLDFGHWAAHRLEELTHFDLRHGEAVAIGLAIDTVYAGRIGRLAAGDGERILACLEALGFDLYHEAMEDPECILAGLDEFREHLGGRLTIMLPTGIGTTCDVHEIDAEAMMAAMATLARRHAGQERLAG
ncbi:MAG: M81 family metallopeptidase [Phycisphaerales bacterium]|nr:M81 family metallopeptidase [Phycisphaerales bacterium]